MSIDLHSVIMIQRAFFDLPFGAEVAAFFARWLILADVVLALFLLASRHARERHAVQEAAWNAGLALLMTTAISNLAGRLRPFLTSSDVSLLIPPPWNPSFPSGHTATAVAIAFAYWIGNRRVGAIAVAIAAFVALGRIATGVHYPTDVFGGVAVGFLAGWIVRRVHRSLRRRPSDHVDA